MSSGTLEAEGITVGSITSVSFRIRFHSVLSDQRHDLSMSWRCRS